jgi:hypothetical protein
MNMSNYHHDPELEHRLQDWYQWYSLLANGETGWLGTSLMMNLIEFNPRGYSIGPRVPPNNPRAEEINAMVIELYYKIPEYAEALAAYYFESPHYKLTEIARRRHLSRSAFMQRVKSAKIWLSGCLHSAIVDRPG